MENGGWNTWRTIVNGAAKEAPVLTEATAESTALVSESAVLPKVVGTAEAVESVAAAAPKYVRPMTTVEKLAGYGVRVGSTVVSQAGLWGETYVLTDLAADGFHGVSPQPTALWKDYGKG